MTFHCNCFNKSVMNIFVLLKFAHKNAIERQKKKFNKIDV